MRPHSGARRPATIVVLALVEAILFAQPPANLQKPNVVLIITDDMGYGDLASYGAPDVATPNIDRLAKEGARRSSCPNHRLGKRCR